MPREDEWELPLRAFGLMTVAERVRVLEMFATLRYISIADRFGEAIHREIMRDAEIRQQVEQARQEGLIP